MKRKHYLIFTKNEYVSNQMELFFHQLFCYFQMIEWQPVHFLFGRNN